MPETLDVNKLFLIIKKNWLWIVLIFLLINSIAYLYIRYTKKLYESESEIKLDVKTETSAFGIKNALEDQYLNLMSGEIELIQSRLFLSKVVEQPDFDVSFISVGRVLVDEMYKNAPVAVTVLNRDHSLYNRAITFQETSSNSFVLSLNEGSVEATGRFGEPVEIGNLKLLLTRNENFIKGDEVGYYFIINSKDALLDYLVRNLTAEPLNYNANTIRISFKDHNPSKAQAVLHKIDTLYLQFSHEQKNLANTQKIQWLSNELKQIESRMEGFENYFEKFTIENKTDDISEGLKETIHALNTVDSQRYELTRKLRETERLVVGLESGNVTMPVTIRSALPSSVGQGIEKLSQLLLEKEQIQLSHNEVTFVYREKENQVNALRENIKAQLLELRAEWNNRLKQLDQRKQTLEDDFVNFPDKNTEFTKNQRFYKLYEEFYLTLMQSKSEFEIAQAGTTPDFKILSPASFPYNPIAPKEFLILGIGLVLSLVINFLFVGILYLANNKITSVSELEKVKAAPLLGSIPNSKYHEEGLHVLSHSKSMVSEAIRTLRTNLDFFNASSSQKVIAISSTISGEGKSFIAMNLGGIMALSNKKVIIVDLDMRKPKTGFPFDKADRSKGVSTVLIKKHAWTECIVDMPIDSLHFLPAGPHPPNPSELLLTRDFEDLINSLKASYDFIILDTPPVGLVTDGIMAMRLADVSIYVFRANYSKKDFFSNLQRVKNINKIKNLTTLLNGVSVSGKTYGYGYYEENGRPSKLKSFLRS